ncbi:hypothetical protein ACIBOV_21690 [Micromonospora chersina]
MIFGQSTEVANGRDQQGSDLGVVESGTDQGEHGLPSGLLVGRQFPAP